MRIIHEGSQIYDFLLILKLHISRLPAVDDHRFLHIVWDVTSYGAHKFYEVFKLDVCTEVGEGQVVELGHTLLHGLLLLVI